MSAIEPWGQFEHDPRLTSNAGLRASDRDRDVIQTILGDAFAEGRLSREEYDERSDATLATRTLGELMPLVSDLPAGQTANPGSLIRLSDTEKRAQALAAYGSERRNALWGFISASLICWVIWLATSYGDLGNAFPWPLFVMLGTGLNAGRVMFQKQEILTEHVRRLERKERKALERKALERKPPE